MRSGSGNRTRFIPGPEDVGRVDAQHIAYPSSAQIPLDVANAINGVSGDPPERNACRECARDHRGGELRLGGEVNVVWNMSRA